MYYENCQNNPHVLCSGYCKCAFEIYAIRVYFLYQSFEKILYKLNFLSITNLEY